MESLSPWAQSAGAHLSQTAGEDTGESAASARIRRSVWVLGAEGAHRGGTLPSGLQTK